MGKKSSQRMKELLFIVKKMFIHYFWIFLSLCWYQKGTMGHQARTCRTT